jgi:hypothetical protein
MLMVPADSDVYRVAVSGALWHSMTRWSDCGENTCMGAAPR